MNRVNLVQHQDRVLLVDAELFEDVVNLGDLVEGGRIAGVSNVQQKIRLAGFFQRGLKARNQTVRQVADETDGVAEQHGTPAGQLPTARTGIERGEEFVFGED